MFERLTVYIDGEAREDHSRDTGRWKNGSRACMERLAAYEDTGLTPDEIAALRAELDALKADIEAGRLVRMPFVPGEQVWFIENGQVCGGVVRCVENIPNAIDPGALRIWICAATSLCGDDDIAVRNAPSRFGQQVFATEEAAIAALEGE